MLLPVDMNVIICPTYGKPEVMEMVRVPLPTPKAFEVLIKVRLAGLNRADTMQRQGKYPPPADAPETLGMEVSGLVVAVGTNVSRWKIGDRVCALMGGGGYAEYAIAHETHCLRVPASLPLRDAGMLPETIATVYANVFEAANLRAGDIVLVHGGASGIGTTAIQMIKLANAQVYVTAGNAQKCDACAKLGADLIIDYATENFASTIASVTGGRGVDIVLDMIGGDYTARNLSILSVGGRHVSIATQHGNKAEIDLRVIMHKRLVITGSTMRGRDSGEKTRLIAEIEEKVWPWVVTERLKPIVYQYVPLKNVVEAHKVMESGVHIGKIGLEVSSDD